MSGFTRRRFLEDSLLVAAAAAAASCRSSRSSSQAGSGGKAVAPSDRLRVAIVGVNGRGQSHVRAFAGRRDTQVVAICDVDPEAAELACGMVQFRTGKTPAVVGDLRRLLEDRSIDAISVAMPNHWHALAGVWAVQAGKDVYLEKPVSHNVREGRVLVQAARKYGRIVQTGSQSRSNPGMRQFIDYVRSGKLGKVTLARGLCYKRRKSIGRVGSPARPPEGLDYQLWLGPAPARADVQRSKLHYDWHWQWDYGNGDIGNQGAHEMDKARWGLGKSELPRAVVSVGGRFGYQDDGQTANTQLAFFDYGDAQLVFEVRGLPTDDLQGTSIGNIFHGSEGYAVSTDYSSGTIFDRKGRKVAHFDDEGDHYDNFVQAVRSRRPEDLTADVEEGHLSAALAHLANVSYRLGTDQPLASRPECLTSLPPAAGADECLQRFHQHLADNGVSPGQGTATWRVGRTLTVDPRTETIIDGGPEAQALMSRDYRPGFVVPAVV